MKNFKGQIEGFPQEVVEKMLERQVEQGNPKDVTIFEKDRCIIKSGGGFSWSETPEGINFWGDVITYKNFDKFFKVYPKKQPKTYDEKVKNLFQRYINGERGDGMIKETMNLINENITQLLPDGLNGNLIGLMVDVEEKPKKVAYVAIFSNDQSSVSVLAETPYQAMVLAMAEKLNQDEDFTIELLIDEYGEKYTITEHMVVRKIN